MVGHLSSGGGLPRGWRGNTRQRAHLSLFLLYLIFDFYELYYTLREGSLPLDDVCLSLLNMLYLQTLPFLQSGNREEVSDVDYLLNLLVAVIANVGGSLISKWLDNHHKKGK